MIEKLTPEQEAKFPEYVEKWLNVGLSTEPIDFEKCKKYAIEAYENAELTPPKKFYMAESPMSAIKLIKSLTDEEISESSIFNEMMYGNHDASWLSFCDFMVNEVGVTDCERVDCLVGLAHHCGWWSAYEECAVFQDRPKEIHFDEEKLLHNESGPAIYYRDGFSIWSIHGKRVTEQIVMRPETLTLHQIDSESDLDLRAIMLERYGWENYLEDTNAKCLDYRDNLIENTKEALYISDNGNRMVVSCPTGRVFSLGVPDDIKTCEEAQIWLGNDTDSEVKINVIART